MKRKKIYNSKMREVGNCWEFAPKLLGRRGSSLLGFINSVAKLAITTSFSFRLNGLPTLE